MPACRTAEFGDRRGTWHEEAAAKTLWNTSGIDSYFVSF